MRREAAAVTLGLSCGLCRRSTRPVTAINYGPYRAGGPGTGEMSRVTPTSWRTSALLQTAGYNLLRLFGGDAVSERILQLAAANYPEMRFQQGLFLEGLAGAAADELR